MYIPRFQTSCVGKIENALEPTKMDFDPNDSDLDLTVFDLDPTDLEPTDSDPTKMDIENFDDFISENTHNLIDPCSETVNPL